MAVILAAVSSHARASYVLTLEQTAGNVVASGSGAFDLSALTLFENGLAGYVSYLQPVAGLAIIGVASTEVDLYQGMSGPSQIGSESGLEDANSAGGDISGVITGEFLIVPAGYTSGTLLSGSSEWTDTTLSGLGVNPGTYTWTWGSGATADSFTLNAASVPEPSTWTILLAGLGALSLFRLNKSSRLSHFPRKRAE